MNKVGIVTVVTNEKYNLDDLYASLAEQTFKDFTLYFVDNNSSDGSVEHFKELNSKNEISVVYIHLDHNSGFSAGSNTGAVQAIKDGCEYLFISNNDLVYDKNALRGLYGAVQPNTGVVCSGPLLLMHSKRFPDTIQEFGGKINFRRGTLKKNLEGFALRDVIPPEIIETDFIGGGVLFIKADVFEKAGMFETSYFGYYDEIDLAYRLKVLNKYKMVVTSKALIWHNHYWTKKQKTNYYFEYYLSERNKFLYYHKFGLYLSMLLMFAEDCIKFPWRLRWFVSVCDFKLGLYYLKGMLHGLLNKKGQPEFLLRIPGTRDEAIS